MILIDANIIMYASGKEHPHKKASLAILNLVASGDLEAAIDTEVLQEILHRYRSIGRWEEGVRVYRMARENIPQVIAVTAEIMDIAHALMDRYAFLLAQDAVHAAAYHQLQAEVFCSYDRDFDGIAGMVRREPEFFLH